MALLDKLLGKDETEEKLKQEIKSLEFRKESVLASINKEVANLKAEQNSVLFEAGKYAYCCRDKGQTDLTAYWDKMQELEEKLAGQEAKKKEMTDRYDEEISLIASNLHTAAASSAPTPSAAPGSPCCPNCGAAIAPDDMFCQSCGTKLQ
jgi:hypothetical protein